jgi:hypothetical protein
MKKAIANRDDSIAIAFFVKRSMILDILYFSPFTETLTVPLILIKAIIA